MRSVRGRLNSGAERGHLALSSLRRAIRRALSGQQSSRRIAPLSGFFLAGLSLAHTAFAAGVLPKARRYVVGAGIQFRIRRARARSSRRKAPIGLENESKFWGMPRILTIEDNPRRQPSRIGRVRSRFPAAKTPARIGSARASVVNGPHRGPHRPNHCRLPRLDSFRGRSRLTWSGCAVVPIQLFIDDKVCDSHRIH